MNIHVLCCLIFASRKKKHPLKCCEANHIWYFVPKKNRSVFMVTSFLNAIHGAFDKNFVQVGNAFFSLESSPTIKEWQIFAWFISLLNRKDERRRERQLKTEWTFSSIGKYVFEQNKCPREIHTQIEIHNDESAVLIWFGLAWHCQLGMYSTENYSFSVG